MLECEKLAEQGDVAAQSGDRDAAITCYLNALRINVAWGPAKIAIQKYAHEFADEASQAQSAGNRDQAISLLVRARELNPGESQFEVRLNELLSGYLDRDLTSECLIFPDTRRAERWYREAIQRAMDFVVNGGVVGDIMEFGVLAGWTARLFAEIARDSGFYGDLHLFDSFRGLPSEKHEIDKASHEVTRGVWQGQMSLPDAWIDEIGMPIEDHIQKALSTVISHPRIKIHKGFYDQSLNRPIAEKAAIVHLDCDLYESTRDVLAALIANDALTDGSVLMFDDWNCNRANPTQGQRRAFSEFLDRQAGAYQASHYFNYGYNSAAFILHEMNPRS